MFGPLGHPNQTNDAGSPVTSVVPDQWVKIRPRRERVAVAKTTEHQRGTIPSMGAGRRAVVGGKSGADVKKVSMEFTFFNPKDKPKPKTPPSFSRWMALTCGGGCFCTLLLLLAAAGSGVDVTRILRNQARRQYAAASVVAVPSSPAPPAYDSILTAGADPAFTAAVAASSCSGSARFGHDQVGGGVVGGA